MEIEEVLYSKLVADSTLNALIGTKLYPQIAPPTITKPYIVYYKVSGDTINIMSMASGVATSVFQFNIWAESYSSAKSVAKALRNKLDSYNDASASVPIQATIFLNEGDLFVDTEVEQQQYYGIHQDYEITYNL